MYRLCLSLTLPVFLLVQSVWLPFAFAMITLAILYAISREIYESFHDNRESFVFLNIRKAVFDDATLYMIVALMFLPILGWIRLTFPNSHILD